MELPVIGEYAACKGLDLLGTSDCLHGRWLSHIKNTLKDLGNGIFQEKKSGTKFILQTEVEGLHRIHHVVLLPDLEAVEKLRTSFGKHGKLEGDGRPKLRLSGKEILDEVRGVGGLAGPGHAFTPYTAVYSVFDSVYDCYGATPDYLELGLSANTELANGIEELKDITFITNSDAHGPWPHRIGREFNRLDVRELSFKGVSEALKIPVIASGGCGAPKDFSEVFRKTKATAALAASIFHYREYSVKQVKNYLKKKGIKVRI